MIKYIIAFLLTCNIAFADVSLQTVCKHGYAFIVVTGETPRTTSVSIVQAFEKVADHRPPQPIKCRDKE